jgi:hypothetical protein
MSFPSGVNLPWWEGSPTLIAPSVPGSVPGLGLGSEHLFCVYVPSPPSQAAILHS